MAVKNRIFIPTKIASLIDDKVFLEKDRVKCYKFVNIILNKMENDGLDYGSRIMVPSVYLNKYMKDYSRISKILVDLGIISIINSYSNSINNNYTKSYIINKTFSPSPLLPFMLPDFILSSCKSISYDVQKYSIKKSENTYENNTINNLKKLKIDEKCLIERLRERVNRFSQKDFKTNHEISGDFFEVLLNGVRYEMSRSKIDSICKNDGTCFIQYKNKFYIDSIEEFISKKKVAMALSGLTSIDKIFTGNIFSNRNTTNNRLDSNITNMAKDLVNCICEENNLIQLDLTNSQLSILCYVIGNKLEQSDFSLFKTLSFSGELYDYLKREIGLKSRNEAKILMFEVIFSKEDSKNPLKNKIRDLFPTVIDFIDNFKKENGYKNFSIMLQKKESEIFIDGLFKEMIKKRKFCLTKHDSLIVKKQDLQVTMDIIEKYFKKINFLGKISIE